MTVYNKIFIPGEIGVFIDKLASSYSNVYLLMYEAKGGERTLCDYMIESTNVNWVNLGTKATAWWSFVFNKSILKEKLQQLPQKINYMIVRSPSALSPFFVKYFPANKIIYHIVGDYLEGAKKYKVNSIRKLIIKYYLILNDYLFSKRINNSMVIVNSSVLYEKYKDKVNNLHEIRTTTLTNNDFYLRNDTCQSKTIKLLYTGRIDPAKGLFELVEAHSKITQEYDVELHIVGWEINATDTIKRALIEKATLLGSDKYITFHRKQKVGKELNEMYQMADLFVTPSYFEGFPRTIWEAMANSLPVITTNVGGIPHVLNNLENALLIKPQDSDEIYRAIKQLITDVTLRQTLIKNGYKLAEGHTLEKLTEQFITRIESNFYLKNNEEKTHLC